VPLWRLHETVRRTNTFEESPVPREDEDEKKSACNAEKKAKDSEGTCHAMHESLDVLIHCGENRGVSAFL